MQSAYGLQCARRREKPYAPNDVYVAVLILRLKIVGNVNKYSFPSMRMTPVLHNLTSTPSTVRSSAAQVFLGRILRYEFKREVAPI
jgi:hypothetical protein